MFRVSSMNKHTKIAIFVAPFLAVGGYIASDYFVEYQAMEKKVVMLNQIADCDVLAKNCILAAGELKISVADVDGVTQINSTFPLDTATLFVVNDENAVVQYSLTMDKNPYYWQVKTDYQQHLSQVGASQTLRLIATIKGGSYVSEFISITQ